MANAINSLKLGSGTYVFTTPYATCGTAAATAAKVAATTPGSNFSLETGARITVKFTVTNTAANPTLNVNSTGAKAIYYRGSAISAGYLAANRTYEFVYNGTQYDFIGDIDTNTDTNTNTSHSHDAGVGLVGSGSASTSGGTYTYKAKLKDETKNANDSLARPSANANRLYPVEVDKSGYLAVTIPWSDTNTDTDTKNTAGSTDTSSKIFLIGATSQAANPQTYSHETVYVGTDGCLTVRSANSDNQRVAVTSEGFKKTTPVGSYEYGLPSLESGTSATIALTSDIPDTSNFVTIDSFMALSMNTVTLDGEQTISGKKTFTGGVQFGTNTVFNNGGIQIPAANAFKVMGMYDVSLPSKTGTLATTGDIPSTSSFATLSGNNTFTGITAFNNTVSCGTIISNSGFMATNSSNSSDFASFKYNSITRSTNSTTYTLTLPTKSGTIALTSDIPSGGGSGDVTAAGNNIFTGTNKFQGGTTSFTTASPRPGASVTTVDADGVKCQTDGDTGTYYQDNQIQHQGFSLGLPYKSGTLATTSDFPIKSATLSGTTLSITLS